MTITNGYCSLAEIKAAIDIPTATTTDDTMLERLVEAASRTIDRETQRTFYARTETHYFDIPGGRELRMDDDLLSVTSLTNGNSVAIASTEYNVIPRNRTPYYALKLKEGSSVYWEADSSGNTEAVIVLVGTWGHSTTTPQDVKEACIQIASAAYKRRFGENLGAVSTVTAAGIVVSPQDIPVFAWNVIKAYKRRT